MPSRVSTCVMQLVVSLAIAVTGLAVVTPPVLARPPYPTDGPTASAGDATRPGPPARLSMAKVAPTWVTLRWAASSGRDLAGYSAYLNGRRVANVHRTTYRFSRLKCGTSYQLGVRAYDASELLSAAATKSVRTARCSGSTGTTKGVLNSTAPTAITAITAIGSTLSSLPVSGGTSGGTSGGSLPSLTVLPPIDVLPPAISGNTQVGSTLTSSTGTWLNSATSYGYQWQDCNSSGSGCTNIPGATGGSYVLAPSDAGSTIDVVLTASNSAGSGSASASPTSAVTWAAPVNSGRPTISGTAEQGNTLSASTGSWSNSPTGYGYQWQDCNSSGAGCSNVSGATSGSYTVASSDVGYTMVVVVTASNGGGSASAASTATSVVTAPPPSPPVNSGRPTISGTAEQGDTLTASRGSWSNSPTGYGYQWQDCNSTGGGCSSISGATSSSYTLASSDVGHTVVVVVTASNSGGSASAASAATSVVTAPPPPSPPSNTAAPTISGAAQVGSMLSSTTGSWSGSPTGYGYQWQDCNSSGGGCSSISGATSSSYTLASSDAGHTVDVVVTASNSAGSASQASAPTATVTTSSGPTVDYYAAQAAQGSGNGSSCSNAAAVSTLSSATEWTPGNVIALCGTITSSVTAEGSGTSGNPITVYWEPNATISEPVCPGGGGGGSGCFNTNGHTYLTLNGGTNGSILSTANGTGLANHNANVQGVYAENCTGCTIENLNVSGMYVEGSGSDDCTASSAIGVWFSGSNTTLANDTFSNEQVGANLGTIGSNDSNIVIENDTFSDDGTGMNWYSATNGGGNAGPILFYDNTLSGFSQWDTGSSDCYHEDGIHCWDSPGYTPLHYGGGIYIYDNRWSGLSADSTAYVFMEGGAIGSGTVCADSTSPIYVFNNVYTASAPMGNGAEEVTSGEPRLYNNTIMGAGSGSGYCQTTNSDATDAMVENEASTGCNILVYYSHLPTFAAGQPDYDIYANGGGQSFVCGSSQYSLSQFSNYQSCMQSGGGGGSSALTHSSAASNLDLNSDGSPQTGSPALGAGANLTSLCTGHLTALCTEINGTPRPTTGAWDAGAY